MALDSGATRSWWAGWTPVLLFVCALSAVRLVVLAVGFAPLVEDEAWYWEWSRRLEWSYATKGPGVAWVIRAATELVGVSELGVRLPALLSGAIATVLIAGIARAITGDRRAMLPAAVVFQSMPLLHGLGVVMTIDGPFVACWALGVLAGWYALARGGQWAWLWLGVALGAGLLFKYTVLLLVPGLIVFAIARREGLADGGVRRRWGWSLLAVPPVVLGVLPIAIWNAGHDWISVRHLLGHLGLPGGDTPLHPDIGAAGGGGVGWSYDPVWTLEYAAFHLAAAGAAAGMVWLGLVNSRRAARRAGSVEEAGFVSGGPTYLLCTAAPVFAVYLGVTAFTGIEANWLIAGYVSLAAIGGWAVVDARTRNDVPIKAIYRACQVVLAVMIVGLVAFTAERATADPETGASRLPVIGSVPGIGRVRGIERLAGSADTVLDRVEIETGDRPFVMAIHYGRAAHLAFYLEGRPTVYGVSAFFGDGRTTQYDLWDETDLVRDEVAGRLIGKPALLFNGMLADWQRYFDRVEELGRLDGEPKADRVAFVGYGFRGFFDGPRTSVGRTPREDGGDE